MKLKPHKTSFEKGAAVNPVPLLAIAGIILLAASKILDLSKQL